MRYDLRWVLVPRPAWPATRPDQDLADSGLAERALDPIWVALSLGDQYWFTDVNGLQRQTVGPMSRKSGFEWAKMWDLISKVPAGVANMASTGVTRNQGDLSAALVLGLWLVKKGSCPDLDLGRPWWLLASSEGGRRSGPQDVVWSSRTHERHN